MAINNLPEGLFVAYNAAFNKSKPVTPSEYEKIATKVLSPNAMNIYSWLGSFPEFREWTGADRDLSRDISSSQYSLRNQTYESSISISVDDIEDNQAITRLAGMEELGRLAYTYPNKYVFNALKNGFTANCYDGKPFFSDQHSVNGTNVSNMDVPDSTPKTPWYLLDTSTHLKPLIFQTRELPKLEQFDYDVKKNNRFILGSKARFAVGYAFWQRAFASKKDLTAANLQSAITSMESLSSDKGTPLDISASLLVVPPSLEWKAKELVDSPLKAGGASNTMYKRVELLTTKWVR